VHILGLRKAGVLSLATDATKTAKYVCAFPGCSRRFRDAGDLKLHQRTHRDGDFHSVGTHVSTAAPGSTEHETTPAVDLADTPLVIVGPYAHHSNLLPWFESIADITFVPEAVGVGGVDLVALESVLAANKHRSTVVGAFTAASNVTGATVDVDAVTRLIHVHGGVIVWDYAAAAPHLPIGACGSAVVTKACVILNDACSVADMNPPHPNATERALLAKDAVVLSPHKFAGGPGCTGLLLVKRALFKSTEPSTAGLHSLVG
jgi:selenocysteine lyase/cysteine desulfurase